MLQIKIDISGWFHYTKFGGNCNLNAKHELLPPQTSFEFRLASPSANLNCSFPA